MPPAATAASTKSRKDKKHFGLFRRKPKDVSPSTTTTNNVPPSVVNVNSPSNVSQMSLKSRSPYTATNNLLPGFEDQTGTILFQDDATRANNSVVSYKPTLKKAGWLARSKRFKEISNWAFDAIDTDGSGCVDEKELYSGLLLIHLKLGCYAGPAACRPVDRERVHDVFIKMDVDQSGSLDREEFLQVMMVLCSNVFTRVMVQWSMTLIIVPLVAQYILNALYFINDHFWAFIMDLDEYSPMMDRFELWIEGIVDRWVAKMPQLVITCYHNICAMLQKVPDSVWNTVPLTLLSCILGCLAVPYIIFQIDDYFQSLADRKKLEVVRKQK